MQNGITEEVVIPDETAEFQVTVDWVAEVQDFSKNIVPSINPLLSGEKPILDTVLEVSNSLFAGISSKDEESFSALVQGFCLGSLMTQIAANPDLRNKPQFVKDMAIHFGAAFAVSLSASKYAQEELEDITE